MYINHNQNISMPMLQEHTLNSWHYLQVKSFCNTKRASHATTHIVWSTSGRHKLTSVCAWNPFVIYFYIESDWIKIRKELNYHCISMANQIVQDWQTMTQVACSYCWQQEDFFYCSFMHKTQYAIYETLEIVSQFYWNWVSYYKSPNQTVK